MITGPILINTSDQRSKFLQTFFAGRKMPDTLLGSFYLRSEGNYHVTSNPARHLCMSRAAFVVRIISALYRLSSCLLSLLVKQYAAMRVAEIGDVILGKTV